MAGAAAGLRWAPIAGGIIAFLGLVAVYLWLAGGDARADGCLGTTDPVERGKMVNRCDHAVSVLACPRSVRDQECESIVVAAQTGFDVRADVAVIAHACRAPYRAAMEGDPPRRACLKAE